MYDFSLFLGTDSPFSYKNTGVERQISVKVNCYNDRATPENSNKNISDMRLVLKIHRGAKRAKQTTNVRK